MDLKVGLYGAYYLDRGGLEQKDLSVFLQWPEPIWLVLCSLRPDLHTFPIAGQQDSQSGFFSRFAFIAAKQGSQQDFHQTFFKSSRAFRHCKGSGAGSSGLQFLEGGLNKVPKSNSLSQWRFLTGFWHRSEWFPLFLWCFWWSFMTRCWQFGIFFGLIYHVTPCYSILPRQTISSSDFCRVFPRACDANFCNVKRWSFYDLWPGKVGCCFHFLFRRQPGIWCVTSSV